jgi:phage gpG-like protein
MTVGELSGVMQAMLDRAKDPTTPGEAIGPLLVSSMVTNFQQEGRPEPWVAVTNATKKRKEKAGHEKILTWSGRLRNSITFQVVGSRIVVGTILPYGRIHNEGGYIQRFGGVRLRTDRQGNLLTQAALGHGFRNGGQMYVFAKKGKYGHKNFVERALTHGAYAIGIPARPYLLIQPEDQERAMSIWANWILNGEAV